MYRCAYNVLMVSMLLLRRVNFSPSINGHVMTDVMNLSLYTVWQEPGQPWVVV